jgi:hypothetical protein
MALVGCGSSDGGTAKTGIDRYAEGKVDTNGVETRPSGTVIQRGDNGDK